MSAFARPLHDAVLPHVPTDEQRKADTILENIPIDYLQQKGYIDIETPNEGDLKDVIHPLLAMKQFPGLDWEDYKLIEPSLRLATKFLTDVHLLRWWSALFYSERKLIEEQWFRNKYGRDFYQFDYEPAPFNEAKIWRAYQTLEEFAASVRFQFTGLEKAYAMTIHDKSLPGFSSFQGPTLGARIYLDIEYLHCLHRATDPQGHSLLDTSAGRMDNSPPMTKSALLRCRWHLAKTILHELCHAARWATTPWPVVEGHLEAPFEPFFRDHRQAELGCAWEQVVLKGIMHPLGSHVRCLYGLSVEQWPQFSRNEESDGLERGSPAKWRKRWSTAYAVPMVWTQALWTEKFWEDVRTNGVSELRCARNLGVRVRRGTLGWTAEKRRDCWESRKGPWEIQSLSSESLASQERRADSNGIVDVDKEDADCEHHWESDVSEEHSTDTQAPIEYGENWELEELDAQTKEELGDKLDSNIPMHCDDKRNDALGGGPVGSPRTSRKRGREDEDLPDPEAFEGEADFRTKRQRKIA